MTTRACQCDLYRDIFAEITAKAQPECADGSDPEKITGYRLPVGPIHRAAGKLGFQMFNGEQHLSAAVARIAELEMALTECDRILLARIFADHFERRDNAFELAGENRKVRYLSGVAAVLSALEYGAAHRSKDIG